MFGNSEFKKQVLAAIKQLEAQISDLKKSEVELKSQNARLNQLVKNLGRKLAIRLPISLESLDKSLTYDLIFPDEIDAWKKAAPHGLVMDIRPAQEFAKGAVSGAMSLPLDQLAMNLENIPKETPILMICDSGTKSVSACEMLTQKGYHFTYVLKGGMTLLRDLAEASERSPQESRIANA